MFKSGNEIGETPEAADSDDVLMCLAVNLSCYDIDENEMLDKLECGPMPNVMAALSNIDGALCSSPQSLAEAPICWSTVQ